MILSTIFKPLQFIEKVARGINNVQIQLSAKSSNLGRFEEFFIVKIKAGLVPTFVLTKIYKVEREPQGESLVLGSSDLWAECELLLRKE